MNEKNMVRGKRIKAFNARKDMTKGKKIKAFNARKDMARRKKIKTFNARKAPTVVITPFFNSKKQEERFEKCVNICMSRSIKDMDTEKLTYRTQDS